MDYGSQNISRSVDEDNELDRFDLQEVLDQFAHKISRSASFKNDIKALIARAEAIEQRAETLKVSLGAARMDVRDLIKSWNFSGTEGAVGLTRWFEKLKSVASCKAKLWNLKVKGINIVAYTQRFQELALLCLKMVTPETRMTERYIKGLSQNIKGNVTSSNLKDIHQTITMAQSLMDQVVQNLGEKIVDNKKKWEENHNNNYYNQNKRQEVASVTPSNEAWMEYVSGSVTLYIS
nr:reverse transcriptase domain-containing protein [Tanacetum cinerariifolium]